MTRELCFDMAPREWEQFLEWMNVDQSRYYAKRPDSLIVFHEHSPAEEWCDGRLVQRLPPLTWKHAYETFADLRHDIEFHGPFRPSSLFHHRPGGSQAKAQDNDSEDIGGIT